MTEADDRARLEADGWSEVEEGWRNERFGGTYGIRDALLRLGSVFGELTNQPEPVTILAELQQAARELEAASTRLAQNVKLSEGKINAAGEFEQGASLRYRIAVETRMLEIYDEAIADEKRPPGEDVRTAKAEAHVRKAEPALFAEHTHFQTDIKALRLFIAARKEAISARQSILKGER